jgi:hypothetical protein
MEKHLIVKFIPKDGSILNDFPFRIERENRFILSSFRRAETGSAISHLENMIYFIQSGPWGPHIRRAMCMDFHAPCQGMIPKAPAKKLVND